METLNQLELQIYTLLNSVKQPMSKQGDIDTYSVLFELASKPEWGTEEFQKIDFLSKRLDISKKFFLGYHRNGRKAVDTVLTNKSWLELAIAILFKATLIRREELSKAVYLKRFNTLFKALDIINPKWFSPDTDLGKALKLEWQSLLKVLPEINNDIEICRYQKKSSKQNHQKERIIPLTVLFYESPIARAYLETIKSLGFKPQKIIELVAAKDVATKKNVGMWLSKGIRVSYASSIQRDKIHYWPKQLKKSKPAFINTILGEIEETLRFSKDCMDYAHSLSPLSVYSDNIESLLVDNLSDKSLLQYLSKEPESAVLYTGGGLVPTKLRELLHLKFLHIHPGFLPNIRGADCTLWSLLLTGYTSATCFYMSSGIDTGDIILPCWLPKLSFDVNTQGIDRLSMYRSVYSFIDPWIRSFVLREVLVKNTQFNALDSEVQSEADGVTFHFMHERLQQVAFKKLFG